MMRRAWPHILTMLMGAILAQAIGPAWAQLWSLGAPVAHQWITGTTVAAGDVTINRAQPASSDLSDPLTAHNVILAEGTGNLFAYAAPVGSGNCLKDNGAAADPSFQPCGGSGTVNSGSAGQVAWYAANGTAVSGNSHLTVDASGNLTIGGFLVESGAGLSTFAGALTVSGVLTVNAQLAVNSTVNVNGSAGVNCAAGTLNTATAVVSNGFLIHC